MFKTLLLDLSVRKKLLCGFGLVLLITLGVALTSQRALESTLWRFDMLLRVNQIDSTLAHARQDEKNFILRGDDKYLSQALQAIDEIDRLVDESLALMTRPETIALMQAIRTDAAAYRQQLQALERASSGNREAQAAMEKAAREALVQFDELEQRLNQAAVEQIRQSGDENSIRTLEFANQASTLARQMLDARRHEKNFIISGAAEHAQRLQSQFDGLQQLGQELRAQLDDPAARADIDAAMQRLDAYRSDFERLRQAVAQRDSSESDMTERARLVSKASADSLALQMSILEEEADQAEALLLGASVIAFVIGLACALLITQLIVRPLQQVVGLARKVAEGDLSENIETSRGDELGQLMRAMQAMTESLRSLLTRLSSGIEQLATAAEEMSAVTEQTSAGVAQQRMETEQVATAMNEMTATVQDVARNAEAAAGSAEQADYQAAQGSHTVQQAIARIESLAQSIEQSGDSIERLKQDSNNIGTVLDVIKSIAEQTNLLALNAAIEAARAGEAGRGFAVVADEVRALARRTQESTAEIEGLISTLQSGAEGAVQTMDQSRDQAGDTVAAARQAGEALQAINLAVSNIQQMNQQIATAAEQQSSVAEEINRSVSSIRDVAEQSAAATEETSAASVDLARLGGELQALVNRFKLA
ncbi:MAG: methyl-accepting chemotaxis protein [Pseudomonadaceae bacterium]|nr:methyl-accepting chemotaxis protein [Pseudomonadaceae bacterium]